LRDGAFRSYDDRPLPQVPGCDVADRIAMVEKGGYEIY